MSRLEPLSRESLSDFEPIFQMLEQAMGFIPSSMLTMGRNPALLQAFAGLSGQILGPGKLEPSLKALISHVTSRASGCLYCQAHTAHTAHRNGVEEEKLQASFEYETNPLFSEAERAALRLAHHAGLVPNASVDADFVALEEHFTAEQIVEIVSVISIFGFLNRWNDTMATTLEPAAREFAESALAPNGWKVGRHA